MHKDGIDLNDLMIKPLYAGLAMNGMVPVILLVIAYFIDPVAAKQSKAIPQANQLLFYILLGIGVVDGFIAIILRQKLFFSPMIYSRETFEEDLKNRTFVNSIICYSLILSITIYGFVFYLISGAFNPFLFFAILSVVAYQIVRPRHGFLQKVIDRQADLVERGKFATPRK